MPSEITDQIRQHASTLADSTGTLEGYKTLADTLKSLADYEKSTTDTVNQRKFLRFESLKSLATILVPFLTVLTLAVTIYFQYAQSVITQQSNEDAQWRNLTDALTKPPGPTTDVAIIAGLTPFFTSSRYSTQAYQVVYSLARRIVDKTTFQFLYDAAIVRPTWEDNPEPHARLARLSGVAFRDMDEAFEALGGAKKLEKKSANPLSTLQTRSGALTIEQANRGRNEVLDIQNYICDRLGELFRAKRPKDIPLYTDFSNIPCFQGNLSHADFSDLDISGSSFQRADVADASLTPASFMDSDWNGTKWWLASTISDEFLKYLMDHAAPYSHDGEVYFPTDTKVSRDEYIRALGTHCKKAKFSCDLDHVPFDPLGSEQPTPSP